MKFRESMVPTTKLALRDGISDAMLRAPRRQFPDWEDFDGVFHSFDLGIENLRKRIGDDQANQLLSMLLRAKSHYESGDNKLGGAVMEDVKMVLMGRKSWAYPKELYTWNLDSSLPAISEVDYASKEMGDETG